MVIHKEYALRRFCEVPLKHERSKELLEKICVHPDLLEKLVFVTTRDYLSNTMTISQIGTVEVGFELQLGSESEHLTLVNGGLKREKQQMREVPIQDPLKAWDVLQDFTGILHVQLVFKEDTPDWYGEVAVPNEAIPPVALAPGWAAFIREQVDLVLWAITLKEQIDEALRTRDERLFRESLHLYNEVCQSCFWQL
ncbi:MAG: YpiB family protein [Limnochordia bacterium]|jgi:hypothetical protein|nr:YpiB family protein [Limnochordia bacterium]